MNSTQEKVFSNGIHLKKPSSYNPKLTGVYLGVLTDIDGEPRSVTSPFKGPDEPQNVQPAISCFISGDDFIPANQSGIYIQDSLNGGLWEIGNQTANASIEQSNEYACILNSGSLGGNFRLYYNGYDSATGTYQTYCDKLIRVDSPSPVELVSFATFLQGNRVRLEWITTTELNNSGFEIERRVESGKIRVESWSQIGFVNGSGTTSEPKEYSYMDRNLETGKYNYRLKQLDFNGNFEYFELPEVVSIGIPDKYDLSQNYPNPFNPYTTIVFGIPQSDNVVLKIFDTAGREVKTLVNEFKEAGYYVARFDGSSLASGTYIYRIESGSFVSARKMVLLK
jgi:hypothetical protein